MNIYTMRIVGSKRSRMVKLGTIGRTKVLEIARCIASASEGTSVKIYCNEDSNPCDTIWFNPTTETVEMLSV